MAHDATSAAAMPCARSISIGDIVLVQRNGNDDEWVIVDLYETRGKDWARLKKLRPNGSTPTLAVHARELRHVRTPNFSVGESVTLPGDGASTVAAIRRGGAITVEFNGRPKVVPAWLLTLHNRLAASA